MDRNETAPKSQPENSSEAKAAGCCSTAELTRCCEPSAKAGCCGPQLKATQQAPNSCGCR